MKLHEFTDRLYAMGGIEQEKKSKKLNESYDNEDVKIEDLLANSDIFWSWGDNNTIDFPDSYEAKKAYELLKDNGFNTDIIDFDELQLHFDLLTEARNPENDEVNAAIRRYLASDKAYIPKKDRDLFDKYGISPGKFKRQLGRYMDGPNGGVISADSVDMVHPDYDLAGDLTKKKLDKGDKEYTTKDWMKWVDPYGDSPVSDNDESRMSSNQFDSLQPYWQEKTAIKDAGRRRKQALQDEEERIQSIKDDTQRTLKYIDDDKARFIKSAKKKATERKNESLNLNESKQGLIDYFNELMSTFGVKPYEQVDYLLGYMSESELLDAIDDFKEYMDIDDSDLDEAVDFAKDDLKQDFLALCKEHNLDKDTAIEALLSMLGKHAMKVLMLNLKKHFDK